MIMHNIETLFYSKEYNPEYANFKNDDLDVNCTCACQNSTKKNVNLKRIMSAGNRIKKQIINVGPAEITNY